MSSPRFNSKYRGGKCPGVRSLGRYWRIFPRRRRPRSARPYRSATCWCLAMRWQTGSPPASRMPIPTGLILASPATTRPSPASSNISPQTIQPIRPPPPMAISPNGVYEFREERWVELYTRKIDEMIGVLKSKGVPATSTAFRCRWRSRPQHQERKSRSCDIHHFQHDGGTKDALHTSLLDASIGVNLSITYADPSAVR